MPQKKFFARFFAYIYPGFLIINYMLEFGITVVMFLFCWGSVRLVEEKKQRQRKRRDGTHIDTL